VAGIDLGSRLQLVSRQPGLPQEPRMGRRELDSRKHPSEGNQGQMHGDKCVRTSDSQFGKVYASPGSRATAFDSKSAATADSCEFCIAALAFGDRVPIRQRFSGGNQLLGNRGTLKIEH